MSECNCCHQENSESINSTKKLTETTKLNNMVGDYVCYCNHVTKADIKQAIDNGAVDVKQVIEMTGAMKNSNCAQNNPKGVCCHNDIMAVCNMYF